MNTIISLLLLASSLVLSQANLICDVYCGYSAIVNATGNATSFFNQGQPIPPVFDPQQANLCNLQVVITESTITITGTVYVPGDSSTGFFINMQGNKNNTATGNVQLTGANPAEWTFFSLVSGALTGFGAYEGVFLPLLESLYPLQSGTGANGNNFNFGLSAWLSFNINGQIYSFDVYLDLFCKGTSTSAPTAVPTSAPTVVPTSAPTVVPTSAPTVVPTSAPTVVPTSAPTVVPTSAPTDVPTSAPTPAPVPTNPACSVTVTANVIPDTRQFITVNGENVLAALYTVSVTNNGRQSVTAADITFAPFSGTYLTNNSANLASTATKDYYILSTALTSGQTDSTATITTISAATGFPPTIPVASVSAQCETITAAPTSAPTVVPTEAPTPAPTAVPTEVPTSAPTVVPTEAPTSAPTDVPTGAPTTVPTEAPTSAPTDVPTEAPTSAPTDVPTEAPTSAPTAVPTEAPTSAPSSTGDNTSASGSSTGDNTSASGSTGDNTSASGSTGDNTSASGSTGDNTSASGSTSAATSTSSPNGQQSSPSSSPVATRTSGASTITISMVALFAALFMNL